MTFHQIIRWANAILSREIKAELYGSVTFHFDKGRITRVNVQRTELPTLDELADN